MGKKVEKAKKMLSDKHFEETQHYSKRYAATVISIVSVIMCILAIGGALLLTEENLFQLKSFVAEHWLAGALIYIFICMVQVIIAFIPGEIVESAAGVIFGSWLGAVICLIGITLGCVIVILLVRRFGRKFVESLYPREKIDSLPILNDPKKRNFTIFILFLIPGTPKDLITYIVGLTEVSIPMYVLLTTAARIPSILMSTLGGNAFGEGKILKAILIYGIAAVVSGAGYVAYLLIQKRMKKSRAEKED